MTILHFQMQLQYMYEYDLFHIYFSSIINYNFQTFEQVADMK